MASRVALLLSALAATANAAYSVQRVSLPTTESVNAQGALTPEVIPTAEYSVSLSEKVPRSTVKKNALRAVTKAKTASLFGSDDDEEYLTDITIGGQTFKVIVDTGS
jgi:predicted aspartyl protease